MSELVATLIAALLLSSCSIHSPQEGDKIGQVAKVYQGGVLCKTTSVLVTGKFGGGELKVTVPSSNRELLSKVKKFNETQEQVKIGYHVDFISSRCSNDTGNAFLDSIEAHPEGAAK
jgi:hypothetical protein